MARRTRGEETQKALKHALHRLRHGRPRLVDKRTKLSITAVAAEANVTPALIHNRYPGVAEQIRAILGKETRQQRDEKHVALRKSREAMRELRARVTQLEADLAKLVSLNSALRIANEELEAIVKSRKVVVLSADRKNA